MKFSFSLFEPKPLTTLGLSSDFRLSAGDSTLAAPSADLVQSLMGFPSASGKIVTRATALRVSSFLSCVKMIAGDIAKYPLILRSTTTTGDRIRTKPALDEPLYAILKDCPNEWQTSYQARFFLISQLLMSGNCFAQIIRDRAGRLLELVPLDAWRMVQKWDLTGKKPAPYWNFTDGESNLRRFDQGDLFHVTNCNFEGNGVEGSSTILLAKEALSTLMAAEEASGRTMANGLGMQGFLSFPLESKITEPQAQNVLDRLKKDFSGSQNSGKFTALPGNPAWVPMSYNAKDAQLLESRGFNQKSIASMMGGACLVSKLGFDEKASTYSSTSAFLEDYHNTALLPHCTAFEQSIKRDLIDRADWNRLSAKHDTSVILGGSLKERAETYKIQLESGQINGNEARVLEDRDTVDGLDFFQLPANSAVFDPETKEIYIPGQDLPGEEPTEDPAAAPGAPKPGTKPVDAPKPAPSKAKGANARLDVFVSSAVDRTVRKEAKAPIDAKFVAEVLNVTPAQAEGYCAMRKDLTNEEARAALIAMATGETNE